ncbi:hypothetical protein ACFQ2B_20040 [Streptomyces stramineus]
MRARLVRDACLVRVRLRFFLCCGALRALLDDLAHRVEDPR